MRTVRVSKKYEITIPPEVRKKLRFKAGDEVEVYAVDSNSAILERVKKDLRIDNL